MDENRISRRAVLKAIGAGGGAGGIVTAGGVASATCSGRWCKPARLGEIDLFPGAEGETITTTLTLSGEDRVADDPACQGDKRVSVTITTEKRSGGEPTRVEFEIVDDNCVCKCGDDGLYLDGATVTAQGASAIAEYDCHDAEDRNQQYSRLTVEAPGGSSGSNGIGEVELFACVFSLDRGVCAECSGRGGRGCGTCFPDPEFCPSDCAVGSYTPVDSPLAFENDALPPTDRLDTSSPSALRRQLDGIDGIELTDEVLDPNELDAVRAVPDVDSFANRTFKEKATAIAGSTVGEDVIDAGGTLTVKNGGAVVGTVTNTRDNEVVVANDGAVAGDIGVPADGGRLAGTGDVTVKGGSTVVGAVDTNNTGGKNITLIGAGPDEASRILGDARTSSGGSIVLQSHAAVAGSVRTDGGGNVKVTDRSTVDGDAVTSGGGNVTVGSSTPSVVGGRADTTGGDGDTTGDDGTVSVVGTAVEPATVHGGVRAGGVAKIEDAAIGDDVEAGSDSDVVNAAVCGDVRADGNVDVSEFSVVSGTVEAGQTVAGVRNSFVGGDVVSRVGDVDIPSSVICGDVLAEGGTVDIDSTKEGPPKDDVPRDRERRRSLVGGVVRVDNGDFDIDEATIFARGSTEPDGRDDGVAILVTERTTGGNDATVTGGSVLNGAVVVDGQLNVDIDGGSVVDGQVEANAGTVSLSDAVVREYIEIGDGGTVDRLDGGTTVEGDVRVRSGGTLEASGPATIEGNLVVQSGGAANLGSVTVEGAVRRDA